MGIPVRRHNPGRSRSRYAAGRQFGCARGRRAVTSGGCTVLLAAGLAGSLVPAGSAYADGQVTSIQTRLVSATAFVYEAGGIEYQWGMGSNQIMEGFSTDTHVFSYALAADRVEIQRRDIPGVATGEPCGIFVERLSDGERSRQFAADYPSDGSGTGNCDISAMLASRILNRGAVDVFSNKLPDAKNIERLDYIFDFGVLTPFDVSAMNLAGHIVSEKHSNNPIKIAAILTLDVLGQPASYGPMMLISASGCSSPQVCYGITDLQHTYSFLQNDYNEPQGYPVETERSVESVGMAFVSSAKLGLTPGQRYHGFSFFADDVSAEVHNLLDPSTFPTDTSDDYVVLGDDADIYGGLSGYFVADDLSVTKGAVFYDVNGDGIPQDTEAGISDITVSLYHDVDGNGLFDSGIDTPVGDSIDSDKRGRFVLPGIPDGNYLVIMDEADPELPPGLVAAPGTNPHPLTVAGGDSEPVYFPFVNPDGPGGSTDSGSGGADGNTDAGSDDGGADGNTDAGSDDGGADGNTDAGSDDGGTDGNGDSGTDGGTDGGEPPIGDSTTAAVNDEFKVNQGSSATFDVLANDIDGAGLGLTLVSVSESPNATITVVDDQLEYRPNFGFYGTDTFLYVMEDADGTQDSGNVTVEVVRYSDLNNNMLNDFIECGCTNLTLQTGVHGSGVGSVSLFSALTLLLSTGLRRRYRRRALLHSIKGAS